MHDKDAGVPISLEMRAKKAITRANFTSSKSERAAPGFLLEQCWRDAMDLLSEGISVHSPTSEIVWANKKLCHLYSKPLSDLIGLTCQEAFHSGTVCLHEQVLATGRGSGFQSEVFGRRVSGRIELLLDNRNQVAGFIRIVSVGNDAATEQRAREVERLASLGRLIFGIAHSVGTPLNIISGYTEFLMMRIGPDGAGFKELSAILDQTRRIGTLFTEALDMAREPKGSNDPIELRGILASCVDLLSHQLRKMDVKAQVTCRIAAPLIYGEAAQLKQAFFNLLLIAAEQVGSGGRLEIAVDGPGDTPSFLTVEVWGIEASGVGHDFSGSLVRLVEPNAQADADCRPEPSLVRETFEVAGAILAFGETTGRGVPFIVRVPLKRPRNSAAPDISRES